MKYLRFVVLALTALCGILVVVNAQGCIPPYCPSTEVYLPIIEQAPTPTPTPTLTPTLTPTPTATPTQDPKIPHPFDNDPKQVALRPTDMPQGWTIDTDGYEKINADAKKKHVISIWASWFYQLDNTEAVATGSRVLKYLSPEDAAAGYGRIVAFFQTDSDFSPVIWPSIPDTDESIMLDKRGAWHWSTSVVRKGNIVIHTTTTWRDEALYELTQTCMSTSVARIIYSAEVVCNIANYQGSSVASAVNSAEHRDMTAILIGPQVSSH